MTPVFTAVATTAVPFIAKGIGKWVNCAVSTWGPSLVANTIIDATATKGANVFQNAVLSKVGGAVGRTVGYIAAPLVAGSPGALATTSLAGNVAGVAVTIATKVALNYLLERNNKQEQDTEKKTVKLKKKKQTVKSDTISPDNKKVASEKKIKDL